eukprot:jgi/Mesen1/5729/ME000029S05038
MYLFSSSSFHIGCPASGVCLNATNAPRAWQSCGAMAEAPDAPGLGSEQAVAGKWSQLKTEINQLYSKITELEMELTEHNLVIGAIEPMETSRRCYRMLGGVLVERTVGEVLPAVQRNKQGLQEVIQRLTENLQARKKEMADLEAKYNIRVSKGGATSGGSSQKQSEGGTSQQGVLVGPAG